jgi:hypothetical protein
MPLVDGDTDRNFHCLLTHTLDLPISGHNPESRKEHVQLDTNALHGKVVLMDEHWAAQHLQVIRTLMERAALYRRALSPVLLLAGGLGALGALAGWRIPVEMPGTFVAYWLALAALSVVLTLAIVRKQALKDAEPFWSPPARRVSLALLPALAGGLLLALGVCLTAALPRLQEGMTIYASNLLAFVWLPAVWMILYGCALHAAGFFMPRGIRLFGLCFVLLGAALFFLPWTHAPSSRTGHGIMGLCFGVLHLAYGGYLRFTEKPLPPA